MTDSKRIAQFLARNDIEVLMTDKLAARLNDLRNEIDQLDGDERPTAIRRVLRKIVDNQIALNDEIKALRSAGTPRA
jgi:hypothetical protein